MVCFSANKGASELSRIMTSKSAKGQTMWSRGRLIKNLFVVSLGFFLYLSAGIPSASLQSSINMEGGWGTVSASVGAAVNFIPAIFLPTYATRKFGLKACIWVCLMLGAVSFFGNFHPRWYTLIPADILNNVGTVSMWTAKGTYITHIAQDYAMVSRSSPQSATYLFFGVYYGCYYSAYVFGNILPFVILQRESANSTELLNTTKVACGIDFCDPDDPEDSNQFKRPPNSQVYLLFGLFTAITFIGGVLVLLFLDPLDLDHPKEATWSRALDSLRLLRRWDQLAMCLISLYRGFMLALLSADFTKSFIACEYSMSHIGYFMISFGVGCCIFSLVLGYVIRWTGRPFIFSIAIASNLAIFMTLLFWTPRPDEGFVYFALVTAWGGSNAVWESQVAALNPELFPNHRDAAYTNYGNSETVGNMVALGISATLCMRSKVYLNVALLLVAAVAYLALEVRPLRRQREELRSEEKAAHHSDENSELRGSLYLKNM